MANVSLKPVASSQQVASKRPNMVEYYKKLMADAGGTAPTMPTELSDVGKGIYSALTSGLEEKKTADTQATLERMNKQGMLGRGTITEGAIQEFVNKPYANATTEALKNALMQQYGMAREDYNTEKGRLANIASQQVGQESQWGAEYGYDPSGKAYTKNEYETGQLGLTPDYIKAQREEENFLKRIAVLPEASRNAAIQAYIAKHPEFTGNVTSGIDASNVAQGNEKDWLGLVNNPYNYEKTTGKRVKYDNTLGQWVYA